MHVQPGRRDLVRVRARVGAGVRVGVRVHVQPGRRDLAVSQPLVECDGVPGVG